MSLIAVFPTLTPSEVVRVPPVVGSSAGLRRLVPQATTALIAPWSEGHLAMYAQAQSGFAYDIPDGGVYVPNRAGVSYGMRQGPVLYALSALGGQVSTRAGRTHEDARCLAQLAHRNLTLGCREHYRDALRALHVDVVVVLDRDASSAVRRYVRFFGTLLGPSIRTSSARLFWVTATPRS